MVNPQDSQELGDFAIISEKSPGQQRDSALLTHRAEAVSGDGSVQESQHGLAGS